MANSYWKLFTIPGAMWFSASAFLGRLPAGMIGLAIILPISKLIGSYTIAGAVAAATMIGMALCAPWSGRLVDRFGQGQILLIFAVLNFISTSALIMGIEYGAPLEILCLTGAIAGGSRLSTGTMVRTRWVYVIRALDPERCEKSLQAAYAFESVIDEIVFILGPIFIVFLCSAIHPLAGLMGCLVSYLIGALTLAIQRSTQPIIETKRESGSSAFAILGLQGIIAATLFIGVSAGAVEVFVVARADELGSRALAGLLMATLAFSSILAGFWYGTRTFKLPLHLRWISCLALLVLALVPFGFASTLKMLAFTLFIAGLLIAPTSIAGQVLTERILPARLLNEGMNVVVTAMILGMAVGSWVSGILIDKLGTFKAGMLPAAAVFVALVIAGAYVRSFTHRSVAPSTSNIN